MEAAAPPYLLPRPPNITPELRCFLDARFRSPADLAAAADVEAEIHGRCAELEASVSDLSIQLVDATTAYSSSLGSAGSALCGVRGDLAALKVSTSEPGVREKVDVGSEKMLHGQLPALANAVARVEMFRDYAGEYVKMSPLPGRDGSMDRRGSRACAPLTRSDHRNPRVNSLAFVPANLLFRSLHLGLDVSSH